MKDNMIEIIGLFQRFIGDGWGLWILTCIALVVCVIKDKANRAKLVYPSLILLFIFFNPIIYVVIGYNFMRGVYWRIMWAVPIGVILAYSGTVIYSMMNKVVWKLLSLLAMCVVIALLGEPIYTKDNYTKAYNQYQIPQVAIDVSDTIMADTIDIERTAIVPNELLCHIRQYTSDVKLMYGRNAYGYIGPIESAAVEVHKEMSKTEVGAEGVAYFGYKFSINYVVFNSVIQTGYNKIEEYGYEFYTSVDGYDIYRMRAEGR